MRVTNMNLLFQKSMFSFQSLWPPIVRILYLSVREEKHPQDLKMGISERGDSNLHFGFLLICRRRCLSHGMAMWCGYGSYDAFFGAPLVISMLLNSTNWYCKSCINLSLHFLGHPFCIFVHAWGPPTDMFNMLCQFLPSGLGVFNHPKQLDEEKGWKFHSDVMWCPFLAGYGDGWNCCGM